MNSEAKLYTVTLIILFIVFVFGFMIGVVITQDYIADKVCVTMGYDTGEYVRGGQITCRYILDVPLEELAPYFMPETEQKSGMWSEEGHAL